jgi:hypothetical protein
MKSMHVRLTFSEELLGTKSFDDELFEEFIAKKNPNGAQGDELDAQEGFDVSEEIQKGSTGFHRNADGKPILWDYQIKGFFKDACAMLNRTKPKADQLKAFKKIIDGLIFPKPREIVVHTDKEITWCTRPLRAQTAQGERVALARSEAIAAGSYIEIEIDTLDEKLQKHVKEWLDYGALRGIGQWRNSGKGRFLWEEIQQ